MSLSEDRISLVIRAFELALDAERIIRHDNPGVRQPKGIADCWRGFGETIIGVITWSQLDVKYDPRLPWSDAARTAPRQELRFEHVITKEAVRLRILENWRDRDHVRRVLTEGQVFAIITKAEHSAVSAARKQFLADGGDVWIDPWAPYRMAGIRVRSQLDEAPRDLCRERE